MSGGSRIEWYSGHTLYDRPRRLWWNHQCLEIIAVRQRGYTPNGAFMELLASDHEVYRLEYSRDLDSWRTIKPS